MLIYVTILIILMLFSKQARGRSTCSLVATSCPRAPCWWPLLYALYWKIYHPSRFLSNLRLPWKTELPWKVSLYWIYILHSGFLTTCAYPEYKVSPEIFHCIEYILYHSGFSSNFALDLKDSVCPKNFHCIDDTFYIQEFWATCACPEKQRVPWIHCT